MAVTIVATPKSATANSYVTLAEAETYFEGRTGTADWDDASDDEKNRALVTATRRLEQETYRQTRTTEDQALKWPRIGLVDEDGYIYDKDTVPGPVKRATFELALAMLAGDLLADSGLESFDALTVGPIELDIRHIESGDLPDNVKREIDEFLATVSSGARLRRA